MNISKRYAWQSVGNFRENSPLIPQSLRGLVIGKSGCGKTTVIFNLLLQYGWLDYNHLYIFGKSLHQQEYKILRKGFEVGLSKQQIHADHCGGDIPLLEFKQFCHRVWSEDHNFVTIDLTSTPTDGKYRQNLNRFYSPTDTI